MLKRWIDADHIVTWWPDWSTAPITGLVGQPQIAEPVTVDVTPKPMPFDLPTMMRREFQTPRNRAERRAQARKNR